MKFAVIFGLSALAGALFGSPVVIAWLRKRGVFDVPNARSSHEVPTPRGLGIALCGSVVSTSVIAALVIEGRANLAIVTCAALLFAGLGLLEDLVGVSPKRRLLAQVALACLTVAAVVKIPHAAWTFVFAAIAIVGVVAYVNAVNFMDGINGISGTHGLIAGAVWCLAGWRTPGSGFSTIGLVVAAGCLGYLPWNFPNARGFLGDVGSYFLGGWLAAGALVGLHAGIEPVVVIAPLGLYFVDTGFTLLCRAARREPLLAAHRGHVYQQLVRLGWSHARSTGFVCALSVSLSLLALIPSPFAWAFAAAIVALYVAAPTLVRVRVDAATGDRVVALRAADTTNLAASSREVA